MADPKKPVVEPPPLQVEGVPNSGSGESQPTPDDYPYLKDFSDAPPDATAVGQSPESSAKSIADVPPAVIDAAKPQAAVQQKPEREGEVVPDDTADQQRQASEAAAWAAINKQLGVDQGNQVAAAQEEKGANSAYAGGVGQALGDEAETARGGAIAGEAQAAGEHQKIQDNIGEIKQLVNDYAQGHIDPNQWWSEKTVPQQIGTVVGAIAAGLGGGVDGAMKFVNTMIDRNIAQQQDEIHRKGAAGYAAMNLLASNMRNSATFTDAMDKTRSEMMMAASLEVQAAAMRLRGSVDNAKIDELLAAAQTMHDQGIAVLMSRQQAAAGQAKQGLAVDPKTLVADPETRQTYKIPDPTDQPAAVNNINNFQAILDLLDRGQTLLDKRKSFMQNPSAYGPYSDSIQEGETIDRQLALAMGKFEQSRGLPSNLVEVIGGSVPKFGSRAAGLDYHKIDTAKKTVISYKKNLLATIGAVPVNVTSGPGSGKHAGEWTYYATLAPSTPKPAGTGQPPSPPIKLDLQPAP